MSGLAGGAALGVLGADDTPSPPHPAPPPTPLPAALGSLWLNGTSTCCCPGCLHKSRCSGGDAPPRYLRGASGCGPLRWAACEHEGPAGLQG